MRVYIQEYRTWNQLFLGPLKLPRIPCVGEGIAFEPGSPRKILEVTWILFTPTEYDVRIVVEQP